MKNILIMFVMLFSVACSSLGVNNNYKASVLTKEEIVVNMNKSEFEAWWPAEQDSFNRFVSNRLGAQVDLQLKEKLFVKKYTVGLLRLRATLPSESADFYIVVTKLHDSWEISSIFAAPVVK